MDVSEPLPAARPSARSLVVRSEPRTRLATPRRYALSLAALGLLYPATPLATTVFVAWLCFPPSGSPPEGTLSADFLLWVAYAPVMVSTWVLGTLLRRHIAAHDRSPRFLITVGAQLGGAVLSAFLAVFHLFAYVLLDGMPPPEVEGSLVAHFLLLALVPLFTVMLGVPLFLLSLPALPVTWLAIDFLRRASGGLRRPVDRPA